MIPAGVSTIAFDWWWMFAALPLPVIVYRFAPPQKKEVSAIRVPFFKRIADAHTLETEKIHNTSVRWLLLAMIWLLLVIASARPVALGNALPIKGEARDLFLAVDLSGSMEERDMAVNNRLVRRIDLIKLVLSDFIHKRQGDRLGLILFADNAYVQAPLTHDLTTVDELLQQAQLGFAGQKTAIGEAIGLAIKQLAQRPSESRTLVLLTDGVNNAGNVQPIEAAKIAAENGIKIYTVGLGGQQNVLSGLFAQSIIPPRKRDIDERTLKAVAELTGGQYFRADDSQQLANIYAELDKLEVVEQQEQFFRPRQQLFFWPLSLALVITGLWIATREIAHIHTRPSARRMR